ncbi:MAG: hypothetical protein EA406_01720 [Rhodospirillales bacterium]|nr:MAG: hypothetical protein EA406_01720 [Rhodospirillales bacterium]
MEGPLSRGRSVRHDAEDSIRDVDRDALHVLPLSIIPLGTSALTRARMIKNVRLESVVEFYDDTEAGSGQMDIEDVPRAFGWPDLPVHPDLMVLRKLALLPSFDMYSLRILLRQHGIPVNDYGTLRLSKSKNEELTEYMTAFTRPLIMHIYGEGDFSIRRFEDLVALFRDPDVKKALAKLKIMAARLEIRVEEVPRFLEDYGDVFLSLSYYRQAMESIQPTVGEFLQALKQIQENFQLRQDINLMQTCAYLSKVINLLMSRLAGRFEAFDRNTADLWRKVSAERFRRIQDDITSYHTTIGGVLCGLTIKMTAWQRTFPGKESGGPVKRANFVFTQMRPGFDKLEALQHTAPTLPKLR